ncbi:MAG: hypothetical protein BZY87_04370 [SAR202 cluster bacterium Io17-Chloro-G6]|nr:MAG: hypothetical protein BZY87_04370 [SAR202 cluster bacterium Io17-Chloro-G6]
MLLTSIHESMADELVLLEFEDSLERYETFYEILENEVESPPRETPKWGYRLVSPGVKYYMFQ